MKTCDPINSYAAFSAVCGGDPYRWESVIMCCRPPASVVLDTRDELALFHNSLLEMRHRSSLPADSSIQNSYSR